MQFVQGGSPRRKGLLYNIDSEYAEVLLYNILC